MVQTCAISKIVQIYNHDTDMFNPYCNNLHKGRHFSKYYQGGKIHYCQMNPSMWNIVEVNFNTISYKTKLELNEFASTLILLFHKCRQCCFKRAAQFNRYLAES